jgi:hypothetical protein
MPYSIAYSKENKIAIELTCEWSGNGVSIEIEKENRERATEEKPQGRLGQQAKRKPEPDEEETNPKTTRKEHAMNKVSMMKGISKLYFAGALTGSFIHIVTSAHKLGGEGIEAYATPFMIDGLAVMGMAMRSDDFSKRTNKIGFKVQVVTGLMSLGMNVYAANSAFGIMFGVALVALFVLAEWLNDQIEGREVDLTKEAEAIVKAASAFLATCTHPTTCTTAKQCNSKTKGQKTRTKKARIAKQQVKVLQGMMTP